MKKKRKIFVSYNSARELDMVKILLEEFDRQLLLLKN